MHQEIEKKMKYSLHTQNSHAIPVYDACCDAERTPVNYQCHYQESNGSNYFIANLFQRFYHVTVLALSEILIMRD